jgi:hypothetical protein
VAQLETTQITYCIKYMLYFIRFYIDVVKLFSGLIEEIGLVFLTFSGACAWIAAHWPKPKKEGFWLDLHYVINVFGGNVKNAENAQQ